jgi:hypothetical protein
MLQQNHIGTLGGQNSGSKGKTMPRLKKNTKTLPVDFDRGHAILEIKELVREIKELVRRFGASWVLKEVVCAWIEDL